MFDVVKKFTDRFLTFLPWVLIFTLISSFLIVEYQMYLSFENYLDLVRVAVWPAVALIALLFFRRVFFYLFLSVREFNFFGLKGELKDPQVLIQEKATELRQVEKEREENEIERKRHEQEIAALRERVSSEIASREEERGDARENWQRAVDVADRGAKLAEELFAENAKIRQQSDELRQIIRSLRSEEKTSAEDLEESRDVGQTEPGDESSDEDQENNS